MNLKEGFLAEKGHIDRILAIFLKDLVDHQEYRATISLLCCLGIHIVHVYLYIVITSFRIEILFE